MHVTLSFSKRDQRRWTCRNGDSDDTDTDDGDDIYWLDWICYTMYVNKFNLFPFPENKNAP